MISDGIMPTNEGRGYVLRRLIRRAARHGRLLGIKGTFLAKLSAEVIDGSKAGYPELEEKKEFIFKVLTNEENQFNKTIDQGLRILADMEEEMKSSRSKKPFQEKMHSNCTILTDSRLTSPKRSLRKRVTESTKTASRKQWKRRESKHVLHVK